MNEAQSTALEICAQAEERIRESERLLLDPSVDSIGLLRAELAEVIAGLKELGAVRPLDPALYAPLQRLRSKAVTLGRQAEHASNLYMGFVQLRLSQGYTRQGLPNVHRGAIRSVEA